MKLFDLQVNVSIYKGVEVTEALLIAYRWYVGPIALMDTECCSLYDDLTNVWNSAMTTTAQPWTRPLY